MSDGQQVEVVVFTERVHTRWQAPDLVSDPDRQLIDGQGQLRLRCKRCVGPCGKHLLGARPRSPRFLRARTSCRSATNGFPQRGGGFREERLLAEPHHMSIWVGASHTLSHHIDRMVVLGGQQDRLVALQSSRYSVRQYLRLPSARRPGDHGEGTHHRGGHCLLLLDVKYQDARSRFDNRVACRRHHAEQHPERTRPQPGHRQSL